MGIGTRHLLVAVLSLGLLATAAAAQGTGTASPLGDNQPSDGDRVSINLRNVDLLRVVELLTQDRGLNIVAAPDLNRKVTVRLQNVHWREALEVILRQAGMGFEQVGNILRIDTLEKVLASPFRLEYGIRNLERADVESIARSAVSSNGSFTVVESPSRAEGRKLVTLVLTANGPDHQKMTALLRRLDQPSLARPVTVEPATPAGHYRIKIDDMPITDAVEQLGKLLDFSPVWESPARGRASVKLERVRIPEALSAILSPLGYGFELSGHVLRIGDRARFQIPVKSRLFKLRFANALHVKALLAPLLSRLGKIEVLGDVPDVRTDATGQTGARAATPAGTTTGAGLTIARTRLQRAELARLQPPSGTLIVTDTQEVLDRVHEMVRELDHPVEVVEIETKLVEAALTKDVQLGIRWDANVMANGASGTVVKFPLTDEQVSRGAPAQSFTLGTLTAANFNVMLRALSAKNKVKILSAPRIATLSHEPARILIGQRFPITVQQNNQQVAVQTTTLDYYEDIGIALTVTPRVTKKDLINLALKPEVSTIASLIDNRFPIIDTREAETKLLLRSGHTCVIGGLLQDRVEKDEQGLPGLSSLPVVGKLFGQQRKIKRRTELMVCVTPRILASATDAERAAEEEDDDHRDAAKDGCLVPEPAPPPFDSGATKAKPASSKKRAHEGHQLENRL